ncbi:hypothetical protein [Nocardioides sp. LHG3406-4]|uniref:hypothetical protein n=1 Tax=Nocardioides sp. LHG3406-4 TaxID=2804575 RepID=UPI003CF1F512
MTVQQPWAWAIVHGGKDVENRTRNLAGGYRGPVAIHAGLTVSREGIDHDLLRPEWAMGRGYVHVEDRLAEISYSVSRKRDAANRLAALMPLGAVTGVVDLVDVHLETPRCCESEWAERVTRYDDNPIHHLVVENPRPLADPIPCRGRLGLWTPSRDVLAQLAAALL